VSLHASRSGPVRESLALLGPRTALLNLSRWSKSTLYRPIRSGSTSDRLSQIQYKGTQRVKRPSGYRKRMGSYRKSLPRVSAPGENKNTHAPGPSLIVVIRMCVTVPIGNKMSSSRDCKLKTTDYKAPWYCQCAVIQVCTKMRCHATERDEP
jgi:hypothetical protein